MRLGKQIVGTAISALVSPRSQAVETWAKAALRLGRPRVVNCFFRADDPHSYLLAQLLPGLRERHNVEIEVYPLPPLDAAMDPQPAMRSKLAIRDATHVARYYNVEFPASVRVPDNNLIARANAILCSAPADPVRAAIAVGRAMWSDEPSAMDQVESEWGSTTDDTSGTLQRSAALLRRRGHYGSAMLHCDGLWTWSIDWLSYMEQHLGSLDGTEPLLTMRPPAELPAPDLDTRQPVVVEMFHSFRSPYSYLALERTLALESKFPVKVALRPLLPLAMRGSPIPLAKQFYIARDAKREARRHHISFGRICDPLGRGIERCLALFAHAEAAGRSAEFAMSIGKGVWSQALDAASDRDMKIMVERAGLSWSDARRALHDEAWREDAERNRADMFELGAWGVPTLRLGDYVAWGQDRIPIVEAKLSRAFAAT